MGDHKDKHGTTRAGDFLRSIGKSDVLGNIIEGGAEALKGNYLGAIKAITGSGDKLTEEQKDRALELLKMDYDDVQGARDMQKAALAQDDLFSKRFIYYLASFLFGCSIVILVMLLFIEIPDKNRDVVNMILGVLFGTGLVGMLQFFFGSSKGSKDKTDIMKLK